MALILMPLTVFTGCASIPEYRSDNETRACNAVVELAHHDSESFGWFVGSTLLPVLPLAFATDLPTEPSVAGNYWPMDQKAYTSCYSQELKSSRYKSALAGSCLGIYLICKYFVLPWLQLQALPKKLGHEN